MGRSKESFNKKEVRKKQDKKRKEKEARKLARKGNENKIDNQDMIAYVDEFGRIVSEPPETSQKKEVKPEDVEISVPKRESLGDDQFVKTGVVSFFNEQKGYGFIKEAETKQNVFVHANDVDGKIKEGNKVTFKMGSGHRGPVALQVSISG